MVDRLAKQGASVGANAVLSIMFDSTEIGDTPADRAGIRVKGENKWLTLIQNASSARSGQ